ncbi:MAG: hypothetical protein GY842_03205 [bacterium]|nr:hypothetical protein [bacterium]
MKQFFTGNSLEQAVLAAARRFHIEPERVAYSVRDKKHGFLKIRRRIVIEVDPESPERPASEAPASVPEVAGVEDAHRDQVRDVEAETRSWDDGREEPLPEEVEEEWAGFEDPPQSDSEAVERAVREVLRFMRVHAEISVQRGDEGFEVELSGSDRDTLTDDDGKLLQMMDHLIPRLVRGLCGQGVPCRVDFEGFRASYERELKELAARIAEEVRRDREAQSLAPMNPADRRIVHLALAEDPDVETESEGEGFYKRVRVSAVSPRFDSSMVGSDVSRET